MILPAIIMMAALGPVELRGAGAETIEAPIESVSLAGVQLGPEPGRLIGWDRVKRVTGDFAHDAEPFVELGELAWRARIRLARGDVSLSRPLFEELFQKVAGVNGPTTLIVAEGLLKCRLSAGSQIGAVAPWLETVRLIDAGMGSPADAQGEIRDIDADTLDSFGVDRRWGLAPELPPMFLGGPAVEVMLEPGGALANEQDHEGLAAELASVWRRAALQSVGRAGAATSDLTTEHPGVRFAELIVSATQQDERGRRSARTQLLEQLERNLATWREAWSRIAIGRSLLMEPDEDERALGVVHLLHVPARFGSGQPFLVGVALAEASRELDRNGHHTGAALLRAELIARDENHPALRLLMQTEAASRSAPRENENAVGQRNESEASAI